MSVSQPQKAAKKRQSYNKMKTGSSHLKRMFLFNKSQQDIDVPDGDVIMGKQVYDDECLGCHSLTVNLLAPPMGNIFGKTAGTMKGFNYYSKKCKYLGYKWSKQRLFHLLDDPQRVLGIESGMTFMGLNDPYERASLIEYLCYLRFSGGHLVQDHWIN